MKKLLCPLLAVALTLALGSPALAQRMRAERTEKQQCIRMSEKMELSEEESLKFCLLMREHRKQRRELGEAFRELVEKLEGELKKKNTEKMKDLITEIEAKFDEMKGLEKTLHSKLKELLSIEQQAKFIVLMPRIGREIRSMIRENRGERRGPKGRPSRPPHRGFEEPPPEEE